MTITYSLLFSFISSYLFNLVSLESFFFFFSSLRVNGRTSQRYPYFPSNLQVTIEKMLWCYFKRVVRNTVSLKLIITSVSIMDLRSVVLWVSSVCNLQMNSYASLSVVNFASPPIFKGVFFFKGHFRDNIPNYSSLHNIGFELSYNKYNICILSEDEGGFISSRHL